MGFPLRVLRSVFGPLLRDIIPPENPETDIGAAAFNTLFWQVAGLNLANPARAAVIASWNGAAFDYKLQAEAWNALGQLAHPDLQRSGVGSYTYSFAPAYPDEQGVAQPTALIGARITPNKVLSAFASRVEAHAWIDAITPTLVQIRLWNGSSGAAEDAPFWLEVA